MNFIHRLTQKFENDPQQIQIRKDEIHERLNGISRHLEMLKNQRQMIEKQIEMFTKMQNDLTNDLIKFNK